MTAAVTSDSRTVRSEPGPLDARSARRAGTTSLRVGVAVVWLSVIVLLPLAAIAWQAAGGGWQAFWLAVTSNAALESFRVTLTISAGVTLANLVFGLLIAWVLVRDDFAGKRLVDAIIDLPFALPTIVASLVMLALYGHNSPVGLHLQHTAWGVAVALAFVTLPFVVRAVQPVLLEIDRETEEAAASLGASGTEGLHLGRTAVAAALAVVRCRAGVLAGDRRVRFGGADRRRGAGQDRSVVAVDTHPDRERRPHRRRGDLDCAVVDFVRRAALSCAIVGGAGGQARGELAA